MASTTSSKGIMLVIPANARSAEIRAFAVPMALLLTQGASTSPPIGSHFTWRHKKFYGKISVNYIKAQHPENKSHTIVF